MSILIYWLIGLVLFVILISIRQVNQYERGVGFTLGRFTGVSNPGWRLVIPVFQSMVKVDIRTNSSSRT